MKLIKILKSLFLVFGIGNMIMIVFATGFSPLLASYPLLSLMLGIMQYLVLLGVFKEIRLINYVLIAHCLLVVAYATAILTGILTLSSPWDSIFSVIIYWGVLPTLFVVLPIAAILSFQILPSMLTIMTVALATVFLTLYYHKSLEMNLMTVKG